MFIIRESNNVKYSKLMAYAKIGDFNILEVSLEHKEIKKVLSNKILFTDFFVCSYYS